jgi:hypothetical protein
MVVFVTASCSGSADSNQTTFTSPEPPDEFASGLTVGFIPEGFTWVWNEGHETATFHVFQTENEAGQLSVGVQISPSAPTEPGEAVTRGSREFIIYDEGSWTRVTEAVGDDTRVDVLSNALDTETLLEVAESVAYQPVNE